MDTLPAELVMVWTGDDSESAAPDPVGLEHPDPDVLGRWAARTVEDSDGPTGGA